MEVFVPDRSLTLGTSSRTLGRSLIGHPDRVLDETLGLFSGTFPGLVLDKTIEAGMLSLRVERVGVMVPGKTCGTDGCCYVNLDQKVR